MIITSEIRFPKFRENRDDYLQSQAEWAAVFDAALKPTHLAGWADWLNDPFLEGTPIFSRVNRRLKKGIVINQILPSDDDLNFRAYVDIFAPESDEDLVEHVVITSILNNEAKEKALKLMNAFLVVKPPAQIITALCDELMGNQPTS